MKSTPARSHKARAKKLGNNQFRQDAQRAHRILTEVRKECNFIDEDEELLFYAFEDGDYIVRGYISKEGNLCFVETLLKEFPTYPIDKNIGIRADGSLKGLCELFNQANLCQLPTHYSLSKEDQRVLFCHEHIERFVAEYREQAKQNFMIRFWNMLK